MPVKKKKKEGEKKKKAVLFSTKAGKRIKWVRQSERELATNVRYIPITIELSFHSLARYIVKFLVLPYLISSCTLLNDRLHKTLCNFFSLFFCNLVFQRDGLHYISGEGSPLFFWLLLVVGGVGGKKSCRRRRQGAW